jgi:GNAT superfamily N-acetyltransferase
LIKAVVDWGKEREMEYIKGPLGFSDMDKEGLLVEGFDKLPSITCIYNYPYYVDHIEKLGFSKDIDWTQDIMDIPETLSDKMVRFEEIIKERYGYTVMYPKKNSEYRKRGQEIFDVMNRAFSVLYEYSRLNDEQIRDYVNQYLPFVSRDLVCIILDKNDRIVAFAVTIPSLSIAFKKANGKLFPFGFIHILRALKKNDLLEALMIGVDPEHQGKGLNAIIFNHIRRGAQKFGLKKMVMNPRLETNKKVRAIFDEFNPQLYMRRRCYKANLSTVEQTISTSSSQM